MKAIQIVIGKYMFCSVVHLFIQIDMFLFKVSALEFSALIPFPHLYSKHLDYCVLNHLIRLLR